jgi:two-component system sensor histidine kinase ChiS
MSIFQVGYKRVAGVAGATSPSAPSKPRAKEFTVKDEKPSPRVLAVDDDKDMLEVIRLTLADSYDVLTLSNPMDTYEMVDLFEPDLIIMDVMMPRITGFQLLELFQKNPRTRSLPVMILSAKSASHEIKHGYTLGAKLYLTKPFEPERLLRNIRAFFETGDPVPAKRLRPEALQMQLQLKTCYKAGVAKLTGPSMLSDPLTAPGIPQGKLAKLRERLDQ